MALSWALMCWLTTWFQWLSACSERSTLTISSASVLL